MFLLITASNERGAALDMTKFRLTCTSRKAHRAYHKLDEPTSYPFTDNLPERMRVRFDDDTFLCRLTILW